jgi:peptide/nickel transport system substrate-binding protein
MIDPATGNPFASWYAAIASTSVVDKNTIKLTLKSPDPVLPEKFSAMRVSGFAPAGSDPAALASRPIGTGPFKLAEWTQNDQAVLQRNGSYWDSNFPYLDSLVVKVVPQEDTRVAGLRAGQLDWGLVSADGAKRLQGAQNLKFISGPQAVFTVLKYNQRFKPFADTRVRQALDMAIDRKLVIDNALGGAGALTGPIPYGWADCPRSAALQARCCRGQEPVSSGGLQQWLPGGLRHAARRKFVELLRDHRHGRRPVEADWRASQRSTDGVGGLVGQEQQERF